MINSKVIHNLKWKNYTAQQPKRRSCYLKKKIIGGKKQNGTLLSMDCIKDESIEPALLMW